MKEEKEIRERLRREEDEGEEPMEDCVKDVKEKGCVQDRRHRRMSGWVSGREGRVIYTKLRRKEDEREEDMI